MPRPTKLGTHIATAFREILESDDMNTIALTDWDLCYLLNNSLKYEDRISYRTFQRYKHDAMAWGHANEEDDGEESDEKLPRFEYDPIYVSLHRLFTLALIKQKK